jgi:hypothetical protein
LSPNWIKYDFDTKSILHTLGLYDSADSMVESGELGSLWDLRQGATDEKGALLDASPLEVHHPYLSTGTEYYKSRANLIRGVLVIPYNKKLDAHLDKSIRHFISSEAHAIQDFHAQVQLQAVKIKSLSADQRPQVDINTYLSIKDPISDNVIPSYDYLLNTFDSNTQHCFLGATVCDVFQ